MGELEKGQKDDQAVLNFETYSLNLDKTEIVIRWMEKFGK